MKKALACSLFFVTIFVMVGLCEALTITTDFILREALIEHLSSGTVGTTSAVPGVFDEYFEGDDTSPTNATHAEVYQLSNITNTGTYLEVTATGYTNIDKDVWDDYSVHASTTSDLYLTFTIDEPAYYYYSVSSTDMGRLLDISESSIHGDGTFSGVLSPSTYHFDIGAWTTGGPHYEYEGIFIVSADPISTIPEPAIMFLLGFGLVGLAGTKYYRKRKGLS